MAPLPATVTIFDLATTGSLSSSAMFESSFTSAGVATTVQVSLSQIGATILTSILNGSSGLPLVGNGSALAPSFQVLTVPGGGIGTNTLTKFGVVWGNGTSTLGVTSAGTTGWPLTGNGSALAPAFSQPTGTGSIVAANSPTLASATLNSATLNNPTLNTATLNTATLNNSTVNGNAVTTGTGTLTLSAGSLLTVTSTTSVGRGQYLATNTNDNATAGNIGQVISATLSSASAVSLTNGFATTICTASFPPGDWEIHGASTLVAGAVTTSSLCAAAISSVAATLPTLGSEGLMIFPTAVITGGLFGLPTGSVRYSLSATTTMILLGQLNFANSTATAYGSFSGRRVR